MSKSAKKPAARPAPAAHGHPEEEVVHVPRGSSPLRFLVTLGLTLFVLVVFTVGDQLVGTFRGGSTPDVFMSWEHPTRGTQSLGYSDFIQAKRDLSDFYSAQGRRLGRDQSADEYVAYLLIADELALDSGIEIPDVELVRAIQQGEPGVVAQFVNPEVYRANLAATGVSPQRFEATLRMVMRVRRYESLLAFSLGQPEPGRVEELWREDHRQYAFDLVGLSREDVRAEAEAGAPDEEGLQVWYDELDAGDKARLFLESYLPERTAAALLSWTPGSELPAGLLERFPAEEGTDIDQLARVYYDGHLQVRFLRPQEDQGSGETPEGGAPDEEPAQDPTEDPVGEPGEPSPADEAAELKDKLYRPFDEVLETARAEAQVLAALRALLTQLRADQQAGEPEADFAALAVELGLEYQSDGVLRSREAWAETAGPYLAEAIAFTGPQGLTRFPVVDVDRLAVARVVERKPTEPPPFADVAEAARSAWIDERADALALEKLETLHADLQASGTPSQEPLVEGEEGPAMLVEAELFATQVSAAGLSVVHQDWFDPARPAEDLDALPAAEQFLRRSYFPGAELFALEQGELATPRRGLDGDRVWLVHSAGSREPAELDIRPAEYDSLRQRALVESVGEVYSALSAPERLERLYDLRWPARQQAEESAGDPGEGDPGQDAPAEGS